MVDDRSERSSERFLRHNAGRAFCGSCVAVHTGLRVQQATAAVATLAQLAGFAVSAARCPSCGQTNTLITATAS